jgi:hypothetical protein
VQDQSLEVMIVGDSDDHTASRSREGRFMHARFVKALMCLRPILVNLCIDREIGNHGSSYINWIAAGSTLQKRAGEGEREDEIEIPAKRRVNIP